MDFKHIRQQLDEIHDLIGQVDDPQPSDNYYDYDSTYSHENRLFDFHKNSNVKSIEKGLGTEFKKLKNVGPIRESYELFGRLKFINYV